jgi:hypothetical protein
MLCPRIQVQGWSASMRQKTSKTKFPQFFIAIKLAAAGTQKEKDGKSRPFLFG